jgi:hypothetical protein
MVSGHFHASVALSLGKDPSIRWIGFCVSPQSRTGRSGNQKIPCSYRELNPSRPARTDWATTVP